MKARLFWMTLLGILFSQDVDAKSTLQEFIRNQAEALVAGRTVMLAQEMLHCETLLPKYYQRRGFEPAWNAVDREAFLEVLAKAEEEGLRGEDYHRKALQNLADTVVSARGEAIMEVLLTDAFLLYASHFLNGKVNPESVDSEWNAVRREGDPIQVLEQALEAHDMGQVLDNLHPKYAGYNALRKVLADYRRIQAAGGWGQVEEGTRMLPGLVDSVRVPQLAHRLVVSKDLDAEFATTVEFSGPVVEAVKRFQARHGLDAVGEVGPQTLEALNVSVEQRIIQVRLNMERLRWINQNLGTHFVFVNIAAYELQVFRGDSVTFLERVIVGKPYRKTPVFSGTMTYLVLNPYWGVPPTILFNDVLPAVKSDVGYLARKKIRVFRGGVEVDPSTINWASLSSGNFPYTLRQDPGPLNALGQVKFMFPNTYNVYIHDTPSREMFQRTERAFSSGCIRLHNPLRFAEYVLQSDPRWSRSRIDQVIKEGKEQTVMLMEPLPVHILYLTAWFQDGQVHFRKDLYDRDGALQASLDEPAPKL